MKVTLNNFKNILNQFPDSNKLSKYLCFEEVKEQDGVSYSEHGNKIKIDFIGPTIAEGEDVCYITLEPHQISVLFSTGRVLTTEDIHFERIENYTMTKDSLKRDVSTIKSNRNFKQIELDRTLTEQLFTITPTDKLIEMEKTESISKNLAEEKIATTSLTFYKRLSVDSSYVLVSKNYLPITTTSIVNLLCYQETPIFESYSFLTDSSLRSLTEKEKEQFIKGTKKFFICQNLDAETTNLQFVKK